MSKRARVPGTGNFARWVTFPIPLVFLGTTSYRLAYGSADFPDADPLTWENSPIYFVWLLGSLAVFSRGAMLGVWVGERDVVVRGWLSALTLQREDIKSCRSMPYVGFLTRWTDSTVIRMLGFRMIEDAVVDRRGRFTRWLSDYGTLDARGTVALAPFSYRQADRASVMLGLRDPQSDNPPRHRVESHSRPAGEIPKTLD